ncbi:hypothetical protein JCM1840_002177 [Sporobolomyces johnsonii]
MDVDDLPRQPDDAAKDNDQQKQAPLFNKVACVGCRAIKVKCRLPDGNIPSGTSKDDSKCTRCIRLKIPCEYKSAPRRGRKSRALLAAEAAARAAAEGASASGDGEHAPQDLPASSPQRDFLDQPVASTSHVTMEHFSPSNLPQSAAYDFLAQSPYNRQLPPRQAPLPPQPPTFPLPSSQPTSQPLPARSPSFHAHAQPAPQAHLPPLPPPLARSSPALSVPSQPSQPSPASAAGSLAEHTAYSLAETAESKVASFSRAPISPFAAKARPAPTHPDPVDLHILSALEAAQLFDLFHSRLNCFIILLDKQLHTPEYVRSTSTVLFTALLAVSAKFFRTDLYPTLLMSAQQLVIRGIGDSVADIGLVQAILLLVYWKEPFDRSAWLRVGFAIRLGYQLGLHHKRRTPLPANDLEARLILDKERTWITLICFDASYTLSPEANGVYETKMVVIHDIDIDSWLSETAPYGSLDDQEQGASIDLIRVFALARNIASAPSKATASTLASHLSEMLAMTHRKYLDANSPFYQRLGPLPRHKINFHWCSASFGVGKGVLMAAGASDQLVLADFLVRVSELVRCFEDLTAEGVLRYMQDNIAVQMFSLGEFLGRLFPQVSSSVQTTIVKWISQIYTACSAITEGNDNSVPAFISRFYRVILRTLNAGLASLPPTRPVSPSVEGPASQMRSEPPRGVDEPPQQSNPFDQLGGMEQELFPDLDSLIAGLHHDSSYWDSLLPGSTWDWLDEALAQPPPPAADPATAAGPSFSGL